MEILFQDDRLLVIRTPSGHEVRISACDREKSTFFDIWDPQTVERHCISEVAPDKVITLRHGSATMKK